ncbi:STT3 domain-containing protein [Persephonella sp.]
MLKKYIPSIGLIGGIFFVSLLIKLKDVSKLLGSENILTCFDCYFYARLAREIRDGNYFPIDYLRNVPDYVANMNPPPLISLIPAYLSYLFSIDLNTLFVLLPPVFSVLFIIPLYLWLKDIDAPVVSFLGGAILGIFNVIYYFRTSPGRLDTDALILFFVFFIIFFLNKAVRDINRSYLNIFLVAVIFHLFMWWYYKPIFAPIFLISLFLGLLLYQRTSWKDTFYKLIFFVVLTNPIYYLESIGKYLFSYVKLYFLKEGSSGLMPVNIFSYISELQKFSLDNFIYFTTDNLFTFFFSFIGLFLFLLKFRKSALIALPIIILGFLSILGGKRFVMYLAPFLGIGLGYIFYVIYKITVNHVSILAKNRRLVYGLLAFIVVFFSFPPKRLYATTEPVLRDSIINDIKKACNRMEEDSYIWTWWDYGLFLEYYCERGTYVDNMSFNPVKLYFIAHSLILYDETKSLSLISFITNNHYKRYGRDLKNLGDLQELTREVYKYRKIPEKPVYVFLFGGMIQKAVIHNMGTFGTDIFDEKTPSVSLFTECKKEEGYYDCPMLKFYPANGAIEWNTEALAKNPPYKKIIFVRKKGGSYEKAVLYSNKNFPLNRMLEIVFEGDRVYILLINTLFEKTLLNRMFVYREDLRNFELFYNNFPFLVIYRAISE